jgi:hypothetical protein
MTGSSSTIQTNPTAPAVTAQGCANKVEKTITVQFGWRPASVGPQWLDLSLHNNGFAPGTFITMGPLPPSESSVFWTRLLGGRRHYARVNTLSEIDGAWHPSRTTSFVTNDCNRPAPAAPLLVAHSCENMLVNVVFSWLAAEPNGESWVDLSTQNNGFAPGTFLAAGPLVQGIEHFDGPAGPSLQAHKWSGLKPDTDHFWRVNTWTGTRWLTSATGAFRTPPVIEGASGTCIMLHGDPFPQ